MSYCGIAGPDDCDGAQTGQPRQLAPGSPRPPKVTGQRARDAEDEVTHADVAGIDQSPRRFTPSNVSAEMLLAEIGADDVGRNTDEKPTPPTQSTLSRGDDRHEGRYVRPPLTAVEPEQARHENPRRFGTQTLQIRGMSLLKPARSSSPSRPLHPGRDEQNEQPHERERSARDATNEHLQPGVHGINLAKRINHLSPISGRWCPTGPRAAARAHDGQ